MGQPKYKYLSVDDILQGIRDGKTAASGALYGLLFRGCFATMVRHFSLWGFDDFGVQLLFDKGFSVVERKIKEGKFPVAGASTQPLTEQLNAYLMQIVKYLGMKRQNNEVQFQTMSFATSPPSEVASPLAPLAIEIVKEMGDECKTMILGKCIHRESWKQIAEKLGWKADARKLRTSLNNCLAKYLSRLAGAADGRINQKLLEDTAIASAQELEEPCKTIVTLFYANVSMAEITKKTGYNDPNTVKNKKYECMRSLNILIAEKLLNLTESAS